MADYDTKILNSLLDSYENSVLSRGENKVAVRIAFRFTKRSMPEYFDESTTEYEAIHACIDNLLAKGFLAGVEWKNGVPGHIVQKVYLNEEKVQEIFRYLNRVPQAEWVQRQEELLTQLQQECCTPVAAAFIAWLRNRLSLHQSVKEYLEVSDLSGTQQLIRGVWYVESNETPRYVREFSILHFGDSKAFEAIRGKVHKVFTRFGKGMEEAGEKEILSEYGIYDTPNYVYLKGEGSLRLADGSGAAADRDSAGCVMSQAGGVIPLCVLHQGLGISGEDLETVHVIGTARTRRVITIENLTSFFRMQEEDALMIYLGGYHNRTRRRILAMIHEQLPDAQYLHFGDIDAGGFAIYEDLCRKTGIEFAPYRMGVAELERYQSYARQLTESDRRRLQLVLERPPAHLSAYREVIEYMLRQGIKLEQECIIFPGDPAE